MRSFNTSTALEALRGWLSAKWSKLWLPDPIQGLLVHMEELEELHNQLLSIDLVDPFNDLVTFCDLMAKQHDAIANLDAVIAAFDAARNDQHTWILGKLRELRQQIVETGRNMNGWNRTRPGEPVTAEKIFVPSGTDWQHAQPVAHWISDRDDGVQYCTFGDATIDLTRLAEHEVRDYLRTELEKTIGILNILELMTE